MTKDTKKITKEQLAEATRLCHQFGRTLEEGYPELKAFADTEVDAMVAELPPPVTEEVAVEEVKDELDDLIARLKAVADNKESEKDDIKTANELIARLEDLKTAKKNVMDFLEKAEKAMVPEEGAAVEVAATEVPPAV